MSEPSVIAQKQGKAGRLTLNRPKALHALNAEMVGLMTDALVAWRDDEEVELVVVDHAEDTRGFCAGGDIRMLQESGMEDGKEAAAFFAAEYRLNTLIKEYPKPYVAIMDGITMGGGVGISVHGSHRIATSNTVFAMPEVGIGLFPDVGGTWFLPDLPHRLGYWLALTGEKLKGTDVVAAGIATHYCTTDRIEQVRDELSAHGTVALWSKTSSAPLSLAEHLDEIEDCFGRDTPGQILKALEKGTDWARAQATRLRAKSPLSVAITFRQLETRDCLTTFREAMRLEYRLATRLVRTRNFCEGVRATLIDKDHKPRWDPPHISNIRNDDIARFFNSLADGELEFLEDQK